MENATLYIKRCFDLAKIGAGKVSPNPLVGAVIVHNDRIIGEGFHAAYGQAHAEVNAINSIKEKDLPLLSQSTIYISLEPCCIQINTPPCTDLILKHKIPKVVFSSLDHTPGVNGKSIEILEKAGCKVQFGLLQNEGNELACFRNTFVRKKRPYIILKYAQSLDGFISKTNESTWLTNSFSKRLVHKWRSETDAILIGTNTAEIDNPNLTNRLYYGKNPLRIILDRTGRLGNDLNIFDNAAKTWIITAKKREKVALKNTLFIEMKFNNKLIFNLLKRLYEQKVSSLIVEGGSKLLNSFIDMDIWDEARVFVADRFLGNGVKAPTLPVMPKSESKILNDKLFLFKNTKIDH